MAIISRYRENVVPEAVKMLNALKHRGSDFHGIATDKATIMAGNIYDLSDLSKNLDSNIALAYNYRRVLPEDDPQPVEIKNLKVVLEGRVYSPSSGKSEVYKIIERYEEEESLRKIISEVEGDFVLAVLSGQRLLIGRDVIGGVPLYFFENNRYLAFASERKALWSLGAEDDKIKSFPPGCIAEITKEGIVFRQVKALKRPSVGLIRDEKAILEKLHILFLEAIRKRLIGLEGKISVSFSGGLDSSIIAALIRGAHADAILITVGLEGSKDIENAENFAKETGLRIRTVTYALRDVEETLPKIIWLIEEPNALKASIKIPEYWIAEVSSKMNCRAIFFGHGGDELFGGYHKYLKEYARSFEDAETALFLDTINIYKDSLEMSEKICAFHGVEARFPYMDYKLVEFALNIPVTMKISSMSDPLRKRILRKYAEQIGLPATVYLKPKKAIQYGTGVDKALRRIARRSGLSGQELINKIFRRVRAPHEDSSNLFFQVPRA